MPCTFTQPGFIDNDPPFGQWGLLGRDLVGQLHRNRQSLLGLLHGAELH